MLPWSLGLLLQLDECRGKIRITKLLPILEDKMSSAQAESADEKASEQERFNWSPSPILLFGHSSTSETRFP
jgi:hypothetical protein